LERVRRQRFFHLSPDKPLTLASYLAGECPEAFVEPYSVHDRLIDMPLFFSMPTHTCRHHWKPTYQIAFENLPALLGAAVLDGEK